MYLPPSGFEENDVLRSHFIRELTLDQLSGEAVVEGSVGPSIPRTIVRFWHDSADIPSDVIECMSSWDRLREHGFRFRMFDDLTAAKYIAWKYGTREIAAFNHCRHPAMRSDYFRLCFLLAEGGFYVDTDDVLLNDGWKKLFQDSRLKVQPLCYDVNEQGMVASARIWEADLPVDGRIFYVNNDPLVAPAGHPVVSKALKRATAKLLAGHATPEIQATTGPGNLTTVLAAHARELLEARQQHDFALIKNWDEISETRWPLSYRNDERNWRNMGP